MPGNDRVRPSTPGLKLTYDDFVHFPDDGKRHELIDGEHFVTPSPRPRHQVILGNLYLLIAWWLEDVHLRAVKRSAEQSSYRANTGTY